MSSGYILLYRQILDNPAWADSPHERSDFEALVWILCRTAYKAKLHRTRWGNVRLNAGEILLSISLCRDVFRWKSRQRARRFLERMQADGALVRVRHAGNAGTVYVLPKFREAQQGLSGRMPSEPAPLLGTLVGTPVDIPGDAPSPKSSAPAAGPASSVPTRTKAHLLASDEGSQEPKKSPPSPPKGVERVSDEREGIVGRNLPADERSVAKAPIRAERYPKPGRGMVEYPQAFLAWWAAYPVREGPNPTRGGYRAWRRLVVEGVSEAALLWAAQGYASEVRRRGREHTRYVMTATRFLGPDAPWEDHARKEPGGRGSDEAVVYPWEQADESHENPTNRRHDT